ncbi:MAG: PQQ-binding-like beta-propeller repeat protein [Planctomycetota bacterium]|nr:PQQ-binding-like beta-propeller repeat protein [Planctomycetota bacterium]
MSRFLLSVLTLPLMLLIAAPCLAQNWPQFRGPDAEGHTTAQNLPLEWSTTENVYWKTEIPGGGWSSPVVVDGRIYLTSAVEIKSPEPEGEEAGIPRNPHSLRVICVDYESGKPAWSTEVAMVPADTSIHSKNSHASPTPLVSGDRIFVHFGNRGTAALDLDGRILWNRKIDYNPVHGSGGSPVLFEDHLILNCDGGSDPFVISLHAATGEERWRTPRPEFPNQTFSFSTPLLIEVEKRTQCISAGSHVVCSYDPRSGKELWSVRYPNKWSIVPKPVYAGGKVLICTGYEGPAELLAIQPEGEGDVTETHVSWRVDQFVPHNPSPLVIDDAIYMISDKGIASCRDLDSGELHWKARVGGNFSASPIVGEGHIFLMSEAGLCTVIKAAKEYEVVAENDLEERTFSSIAPQDGNLIIRTETMLYRIEN